MPVFAMDFDGTIAVNQYYDITSIEDGVEKVEPLNLPELVKITSYLQKKGCSFFLCSLKCVDSRKFAQKTGVMKPPNTETQTTFHEYLQIMRQFVAINIPAIDVITSKEIFKRFHEKLDQKKDLNDEGDLVDKNELLELIRQKVSQLDNTDVPEEEIILVDDNPSYQASFGNRRYGFIYADPLHKNRNPEGQNLYLLHMLIAGCEVKQQPSSTTYGRFFKSSNEQPSMTAKTISQLEQSALEELSKIPEITDQFVTDYIDPLRTAYSTIAAPHPGLRQTYIL